MGGMVSRISASILWIRKEEPEGNDNPYLVKAPDFVEAMVTEKNTTSENTENKRSLNVEQVEQNTEGKKTEGTETQIKKVEEIDFMTVSSISFTENQILYNAKAFVDAVPATDKGDWQERKLQFFYALHERSCEEEKLRLEDFIEKFLQENTSNYG